MMRTLVFGAMLLASPAMAQEAPGWMKPGPGRNTVASSCATCHTLDYIRMNSVFLSPDAWKAEVTKMRSSFGAPIDDETAARILKYLDANYAATPKS
jgi:hypothetical protein